MRRLLAVLGSCALVLALAAPAAAKTPGIYLAMGDSIAWGDGASIPTQTAYVPRLFPYFHGNAHYGVDTLVNQAQGGLTTSTFIEGDFLGSARDLINEDSDVKVLTLSIGGNDLQALLQVPACQTNPMGEVCQGLVAVTLAQVAYNLNYILVQLHTALAADPGDEPIFVLTLFNPLGGSGDPFEAVFDAVLLGPDGKVDCAASPTTWAFDDIETCIARGFGDPVVDGNALFGDQGFWLTHMSDGLGFNAHPTDEGYELIAWGHRMAAKAWSPPA